MSRLPRLALPVLPRLPLLPGLELPEDRLLGLAPPEPTVEDVAPAEPEITPEEERSLLSKLIGGASYVAESLGKPQAAIGGFLSTGDPEQLLHLVPFSETFGFAPKKKISGRKMLQKAGLLGPNKPGFDLGDVAGFAAEVATDPLMLLTGPLGTFAKGATAATKGVKGLAAAKTALKATEAAVAGGKLTGLGRAVRTPAGVAAQIRAGERGLLGLKLPFAAEPFVTFGEGSKVGAWAVEKMFYGGGHANPLVWMRGIFSHSAAAKNLSEFFQRNPGRLQRAKDLAFAGDQLVKDALVDVGTAVAREEPRLYETLGKIAEHHNALGDTDSVNAAVRTMLEMKQGLPKGEELLSKLEGALGIPSGGITGKIPDFKEQIKSGRFYLFRKAEAGETVADATKPHGAFFNVDYPGFTTFHAKSPGPEIRAIAMPQNPLHVKVSTSDDAAIQALKTLQGEEFVKELKKLGEVGTSILEGPPGWGLGTERGTKALAALLKQKYPEVEWARYSNAREMLMGLGGIEARKAGHDAIVMINKGIPEATEVVILNPAILRSRPAAAAALDDIVSDAGKLADDFYRYAETIQEMQDATYARLQALGLDTTWLDDLYGRHNARRPSELIRAGLRAGKRQRIDPWYKFWMHRAYRDIPGMTRTVNSLSRNPTITGVRDYVAAGRGMFTEAEIAKISARVARKRTFRQPSKLREMADKLEAKAVRFTTEQPAGWREQVVGFREQAAKLKTQAQIVESGGRVPLSLVTETLPKKLISPTMARAKFAQILRAGLDKLGVPADKMPDKIPELQTLLAWKGDIERPFETFWKTARVDEVGQMIDDAGELVLRNGQPVSRESELVRLLGDPATGDKGAVRRLVQRLRRLPPQVREKGIFDRRPLEDALDYMHSVLEWESNLRLMHHFLGQKGIVGLADEKPDWLSLEDVWRGIRTRGRKKGLTSEGLDTFVNSIREQYPRYQNLGGLRRDLRVSPGTANILQNYIDIGKPQYKAEWQRIVDPINRLFRSLYFMVWPASHVRNLGGGFFNSWSAGRVNFWELGGGYDAARRYLRGKGTLQVEALLRNTDLLKGVGRDLEITAAEGGIGGVPQITAKTLPGHIFEPLTPTGLKARGARKALGFENVPADLAAAGKRPQSAVLEAGTRAYNVVEFLNRVGYAEALAKKGFADSEILQLVKEAQFDYRLASPFEREYAQRGVLFWNFPRNNIPFTLANIAKRPGGRTAQTLRAMRVARGEPEEEYTPEMLQEGLGIRTGGTEQAAHFLRQSGVPPEDLNRLILEGGLPSGRTLERAASTLHPLLLAPLELASGRQFYTGRKLRDLWSPTKALGYEVSALDRLLHYSPLSRVGRELGGVFDTRKTILQRALNALTGFKTATYDLESLREQDLRRAIERELKRMPGVYEITTPYVPKAKRAEVGPETQRKLRQLRAVNKRIRDLREERARREAAAGKN